MTFRKPVPVIFTEKTKPDRGDVDLWQYTVIAHIMDVVWETYKANGFVAYADLDLREFKDRLTDSLSDATADLVKALEDDR
jgi:hypothetical protein